MSARRIKTTTRADISSRVSRKVNISKSESDHLVESIINTIGERLASGENVKLSGFGNFVIQHQKPRIGRNPKTGKEVMINPRRAVVFKPSPKINARVDAAHKAGVSEKETGQKNYIPQRAWRAYA